MRWSTWDSLVRNGREVARSEGFEPPTPGSEDLYRSRQGVTFRTNRAHFVPAPYVSSRIPEDLRRLALEAVRIDVDA